MRSTGNVTNICQRDDLHQLSQGLNKQAFNVMAHKRIKKAKPIITEPKQFLKSIATETKQPTRQDHGKPSRVFELQQSIKNPINRRLSTFQNHISSHSREKNVSQKFKMNQTVSVKSKSYNQSQSLNKSKKSDSVLQLGQMEESMQKMQMSKNIEKQFNQGPLKEKHLMNWLNQILIQYCFDVQFEKGQLKALERFGLDQNNLLSRGINLTNISRLYKMLFVYSMGFSNLLRESVGGNRSVMKSIWKAYAILLEYCSEGSFQTIMGELERDMIKNEERLIKQIQKRQILIDNSEEIMEERLHKYMKDNKDLTHQVKNLEEKNEILEKQFRQIEMAYNMEVNLRLSYQYKINEIYSVHEKLKILHLNLYKDFQDKLVENKKINSDSWSAKKTMIQLKANNQQLDTHLNEMRNALSLNQNLIEGLRMNEQQLTEKLFAEINVKREDVAELKEKEKKIQQLQRQVKSSNLVVEMMKSSSNSHLDEYRRLMMENSQLRRVSQSQLERINEMLSDIKFLNSKQSTLKSELEYSSNKIKELEKVLQENDATIDSLTIQYEKKEVEFRTKCVELESQERLVVSMDHSIKQMKLLYDKIEEDNKILKVYSQEMDEKYVSTHQKVLSLQLEFNALKEQKFQIELELSKRIGQIVSLKKKYQSEYEQQTKQYEKLHKNWSSQDAAQASLAEQLQSANSELQKANIRISFLSQQFTDISFEKSKISAIYKDNLILHDRQKDAQKQLMIQISKLNQDLDESHRKVEINAKNAHQQLTKLSKEKQAVEKRLQRTELALRKKDGFVHPMLLEDALQTLKRQIENHYTTRITLENQVAKEVEKNAQLYLDLHKKEGNFRNHIKELQKRVDKMKGQMQGERQYFQSKSEQLNSLIYNLETKLTYKSMEVEMKQQNSNQAKFQELVKAKNSQIQQLLSELERIEDSYQKKCDTYESQIQYIHKEKHNIITELKESKKQLETKVGQIEKTFKQKLAEKERQKEEIVQKLMEQHTPTEGKEDVDQGEKNKKTENKRTDFISRLKFATVYYKN